MICSLKQLRNNGDNRSLSLWLRFVRETRERERGTSARHPLRPALACCFVLLPFSQKRVRSPVSRITRLPCFAEARSKRLRLTSAHPFVTQDSLTLSFSHAHVGTRGAGMRRRESGDDGDDCRRRIRITCTKGCQRQNR